MVVLLVLSVSTLKSNAQKGEISPGFGIPETLNLRVGLVNDGFEGGLAYGFLPGYEVSLNTFSFDMGVPFGKTVKKAESKRAIARLLFTYYRDETQSRIYQDWFLNLRAGARFFFSSNTGICLEGGIAFLVSETIIQKSATQGWLSLSTPPILPSLSARFFYQF